MSFSCSARTIPGTLNSFLRRHARILSPRSRKVCYGFCPGPIDRSSLHSPNGNSWCIGRHTHRLALLSHPFPPLPPSFTPSHVQAHKTITRDGWIDGWYTRQGEGGRNQSLRLRSLWQPGSSPPAAQLRQASPLLLHSPVLPPSLSPSLLPPVLSRSGAAADRIPRQANKPHAARKCGT